MFFGISIISKSLIDYIVYQVLFWIILEKVKRYFSKCHFINMCNYYFKPLTLTHENDGKLQGHWNLSHHYNNIESLNSSRYRWYILPSNICLRLMRFYNYLMRWKLRSTNLYLENMLYAKTRKLQYYKHLIWTLEIINFLYSNTEYQINTQNKRKPHQRLASIQNIGLSIGFLHFQLGSKRLFPK